MRRTRCLHCIFYTQQTECCVDSTYSHTNAHAQTLGIIPKTNRTNSNAPTVQVLTAFAHDKTAPFPLRAYLSVPSSADRAGHHSCRSNSAAKSLHRTHTAMRTIPVSVRRRRRRRSTSPVGLLNAVTNRTHDECPAVLRSVHKAATGILAIYVRTHTNRWI